MKELIKQTLTKYNTDKTPAEIEDLTNFFEDLCHKPIEKRTEDDLEQLTNLHFLMFAN